MSTPWVRKAAGGGSLPSDRLRTSRTPTPPVRGKGKAPMAAELPKSDRVRELEALLAGVRSDKAGGIIDPHGGCFCLARVHPLSAYTPLCTRCGLILCKINHPHYACPSCIEPLPMLGLAERLEDEKERALAEEEEARKQVEEVARTAAGAFPTLQSTGASIQPQAPAPTTHKVMSLNQKTGRVKVAAYSPVPSRPATPGASLAAQEEEDRRRRRKEEEERGSRIERPPPDVVVRSLPRGRWGDGLELGGGGIQYVGSGVSNVSHGKGKNGKPGPSSSRQTDKNSKSKSTKKDPDNGSGTHNG